MLLIQLVLQYLLLWITLVQCQCWSSYTGTCADPYSQYTYSPSYTPYGVYGYPGYSTQGTYEYNPYNAYMDGGQQPIVVVVGDNDNKDKWEWLDLVSVIASLRGNNGNDGPVYIPYPIPVPYGDSCDFDNDFCNDSCSRCGCKNKGCNCRCGDSYDCCDYGNCECRKKGRCKCGSNSDCGCNKCNGSIKHKCDCCRN